MPNQSVPHASGLKKAAAEPKQRDVHRICISCFVCIATRKLRNKMGNDIATSATTEPDLVALRASQELWRCHAEIKQTPTYTHTHAQAHTMAHQTL